METMIKDRFVQRVLEHQGQRLLKNQGNALYKKLRFRTGRLQSARSVNVVAGNDDLDGKLIFSHTDYERFQDMKRTIRNRKGKRRRDPGHRIHNRFVYGHFYAIARELSTGLTESVCEEIRNELNITING